MNPPDTRTWLLHTKNLRHGKLQDVFHYSSSTLVWLFLPWLKTAFQVKTLRKYLSSVLVRADRNLLLTWTLRTSCRFCPVFVPASCHLLFIIFIGLLIILLLLFASQSKRRILEGFLTSSLTNDLKFTSDLLLRHILFITHVRFILRSN